MSGTGGSRQRPSSNKRVRIPGQQPADILNSSKNKSVSPTPGEPLVQTETAKSLLTTKKKATKPAYLQSLSQSEKAENFKIIDNMNKKIAYMKNPRYKVNKAPITMTTVSRASSSLTRFKCRQTEMLSKPNRHRATQASAWSPQQ